MTTHLVEVAKALETLSLDICKKIVREYTYPDSEKGWGESLEGAISKELQDEISILNLHTSLFLESSFTFEVVVALFTAERENKREFYTRLDSLLGEFVDGATFLQTNQQTQFITYAYALGVLDSYLSYLCGDKVRLPKTSVDEAVAMYELLSHCSLDVNEWSDKMRVARGNMDGSFDLLKGVRKEDIALLLKTLVDELQD